MTNWQYGIVIAIALLCFGYGYFLGYSQSRQTIKRMERYNDALTAEHAQRREHFICQRDEARERYCQAAAIARGAFVADGGAPAGTGDEQIVSTDNPQSVLTKEQS